MDRARSGRLLLITGNPGAGKTTALRRVAAALAGRRLGGFYTEEIREAGERRGFRLVTFDGRRAVMAHVDLPGPHRVGKYRVDLAVLDGLAASTLGGDAEVYLVDEIGKMECLSGGFVAAMRRRLDSPRTVIATVAQRGEGLIAEVKRRPGAVLWQVTRGDRDRMPERVLAWLAGEHGY